MKNITVKELETERLYIKKNELAINSLFILKI